MLKFTGKLVKVFESKKITDKMTKREFVVQEEADKYPQSILFEVINDKCKLLDDIKVGSTIEVAFNLRGREYNGKFYNTLSAWSIKKAYINKEVQPEVVHAEVVTSNKPDTDDLPF